MANIRYRRGNAFAADMAVYARTMEEDEVPQHLQLKRNLITALREDVTDKQRQALLLYYGEGMNMKEIGARLGVDKSTVSRNIKRGERRLRRCLRYGAKELLECEE